jgi:hypothetical protein
MLKHISIEEKKVHPPNTYMYNLERSSQNFFHHHLNPWVCCGMRLRRRSMNLRKNLKLVLILLDKGLMPTG